ncbi:MAG: glycosyltransferase family 4 protein [Halioglobus sp.]
MRIAIVAEDYPPNHGGIADYISGIAHALDSQGHNVEVVAARVTGDEKYDETSPVRVTRIGERDIRRNPLGIVGRFRSVLQFEKELQHWFSSTYSKVRPDFAIVGSVSSWAKVCSANNIPYFVGVHGGDAFGKRADLLRTHYRKHTVRKVFCRARCVGANSRFTQEKIVDFGVSVEKTLITYCGVADEFLGEIANIGIDPTPEHIDGNLLMLCRLVKFKAVDVVIKAIARLVPRYPSLNLKIAGDGPESEPLKNLVKELGITQNIEFLGYIGSVGEKAELLKACDAYVMSGRFDPVTARQETFGIVFAECGASSRPGIGPRIGGVPEVISHGETGLLVEPDNVDSLASAIETLLTETGLASRMGDAGRIRVAEYFNYQKIAELIVERMSTQ